MIDWHRLFGLFLMDLFTDSAYEVELEKDLSIKQQFLDVVILRKHRSQPFTTLPDGLENLARHNLLSYKSMHEPLNDWALKELTGHYVNYRKQVCASLNRSLPERHFSLYGVSTRFPRNLSRLYGPLHSVKPGVYEVHRGSDIIRIIVLSQIAAGRHNAIWRLFSADRGKVLQARHEYPVRRSGMSTIVYQLFQNYQSEKIDMPYTMEDFQKDFVREHLDWLSPDDRLRGLSPGEVLKRFSPHDRLDGLSPDDIVNDLSPVDLEKLMAKLQKNRNR